MIAVLLYLIGLVSVVTTIVLVGLDAQAIYYGLLNAYNAGANANDFTRAMTNVGNFLSRTASAHAWALTPFLGGLLLMGFARIMVLLGSINRALRHTG